MDIICRKCGEPWEVAYLRHDVAYYICRHGQTVGRSSTGVWHHRKHGYWDDANQCQDPDPRLEIETADNEQVPPEVAKVGEQGWYQFVVSGRGCPYCYGQPERQQEVELTWAQLDELDAATEGQLNYPLP